MVTDVVPRRLTCLQEGPAGGVLEGQLHRAVRRDRHPRDQVRILRAKMQLIVSRDKSRLEQAQTQAERAAAAHLAVGLGDAPPPWVVGGVGERPAVTRERPVGTIIADTLGRM